MVSMVLAIFSQKAPKNGTLLSAMTESNFEVDEGSWWPMKDEVFVKQKVWKI